MGLVMDIEAIKSTPLGRAWLSAFVRRVWGSLDSEAQVFLVAASKPARLADEVRHANSTAECNAVGRLCRFGVLTSDWRWLTPLGVEVYLYGRKQARKRGRRG
jgi:hypothetical protein